LPRVDTKANASMDVLGGGFKPSVALGLQKASERDDGRKAVGSDLSKNVVKQSIMCVVIHGFEKG
jgi:hypothetical protein